MLLGDSGKTTILKNISCMLNKKLHILDINNTTNCKDIIGCLKY